MYKHTTQIEQDAQIIAANPETSIFLSASAGTGKTKVLCDRFLNLMLSGSAPEKILCITYTNSAAMEMLDRIMLLAKFYAELDHASIKQKFNAKSEAQVLQIKGLYQKVLLSKYQLKIKTLHSFCLDIITRYKEACGSASKRLIDPAVKKKVLGRIFEKISTNFLELEYSLSESFLELSEHCSIGTISERVLSLMYRTSDLEKYLARWSSQEELARHIFKLNEAEEDFDYDQGKDRVFEKIDNTFIKILKNISKVEDKAYNLLDVIADKNYNALVQALLTLEYYPRKTFITKKAIEADPRIFESMEALQQALISLEQKQRNYMFAKLNLCFIQLAKEVLKQYTAFKQANHYMDYDDILAGAIDLMTSDPGILYNLDYKIDHILVDEAQDLSERQWSLIEMLSEEFFAGLSAQEQNRTLFIVGDFKQSIFSFQGAEPDIFKSRSNLFASKATIASWKEVEMNKSFRSEYNIIKLVNSIFPNFFKDFIDHIVHKEGSGHVEVWPLIELEKKEKQMGWKLPQKDIDSHDKHYQLADFICTQIVSWLEKGRVIAGSMKEVRPSDIMILVRKRSEVIDMLAAGLRSKGLSVVTPNHGRFIEELVIMDMISVLEFILNPSDDLNLAGLLKSPFFNFSEDDLFEVSYKREGTLLNALETKFPLLANELMEIQTLFDKTSILDAFQGLLFNGNKYDNFISRLGGSVITTIDSFLDAVQKFELLNTGMGIRGFLEYLEFYQVDSVAQHQNIDTIRIMTVHAAKGLQAPIVILADAASSESKLMDDVFFHDGELYFAVGAHQKSKEYELRQELTKQADHAESLRLLYVAITRAESELYVTGVKNRSVQLSWYDIIAEHVSDELKSELTYIPIKYTPETPIISDKPREYKLKKTEYKLRSRDVLEGDIIHDFLDKLSVFKNQAMDAYLARQKHKFRSQFASWEIDKFYSEAKSVVEAFPHIFEPRIAGINEQAFITLNGESVKFLRIDRMIMGANSIEIIDFKTDDNPPKTISSVRKDYIDQVGGYVRNLKSKFPDHEIKGSLLWTKSKEIIEVIRL